MPSGPAACGRVVHVVDVERGLADTEWRRQRRVCRVGGRERVQRIVRHDAVQRQVDADDDESGRGRGIRDQRERAAIFGDAVLVDHHRPAGGRLDGRRARNADEHGTR